MNHLRLDTSQPDRVTIWLDVAGRSVNVLSEPVFDELRQCLDEAWRLRPAMPVVLRSAKPKGFVVGADLRRLLAIETDAQIQAFLRHGQECFNYLEQLAGDTLAVIEGPCLGGGLELALACRYRLALDTPQTQLGMPEAKLGLMPGWGGTQRLVERVGVKLGLQLLLTGEPVDARRACEIGLVDAIGKESHWEDTLTHWVSSVRDGIVIPLHRGQATSESLAALDSLDTWEKRAHIEALSPAQRATLQAVVAGLRQSRDAGLRAERELFFPLLQSPEAREKLQRFAGPH